MCHSLVLYRLAADGTIPTVECSLVNSSLDVVVVSLSVFSCFCAFGAFAFARRRHLS